MLRSIVSSTLLFATAGCISAPTIGDGDGGTLPGLLTDGPSLPAPDTDFGDAGDTTFGTGTGTGGADTGAGTDTADRVPGDEGFDEPGVFGDDQAEVDIVGSWTSPWNPVGVADRMLTIESDGRFVWRDSSADCAAVSQATGLLWVEASQLVMQVQSWNGPPPWDTAAAVGENFTAPVRLRLGYAAMGEFMGLDVPAGWAAGGWAGRTYDRLQAGVGPEGQWVSESEMWAVPAGQTEAQLIVRDRFTADLRPSGLAELRLDRSHWWPDGLPSPEAPSTEMGIWIDQTPGNTAGAATVVRTDHAYDGLHLITFTGAHSLRVGVVSDCAP